MFLDRDSGVVTREVPQTVRHVRDNAERTWLASCRALGTGHWVLGTGHWAVGTAGMRQLRRLCCPPSPPCSLIEMSICNIKALSDLQ